VSIENRKHPPRVVRPSALQGHVYYVERIVHLDGFNSGHLYIVRV
jgi:hypothetical protein